MSENQLQSIFQSVEKVSKCLQHHLSNFIRPADNQAPTYRKPLFSLPSSPRGGLPSPEAVSAQPMEILKKKGTTAAPVTKEELGRATWTFLHTLGAQYPENPTRQQKKDVKDLMAILSRVYPCQECAGHFKEVLRANPVQAGSHAEFSQWLCHIHNVVNRSLGKAIFPCERVDSRWGKLDCEQRNCDVQGSLTIFDK
ncbi:hypothetical protein SAY87_020955 [Trapa incisa]|uniref:Sulfhydryl oxidase n=2 Tax=Trapa TaxID=22665 RepID=A0AAN7RIW9_TRANT|nr:hypothetical protein SAY87_020955 [Trapa incisa]KAK4804680.1 hypothetical protein SAY86_004497 [Trapa natans]